MHHRCIIQLERERAVERGHITVAACCNATRMMYTFSTWPRAVGVRSYPPPENQNHPDHNNPDLTISNKNISVLPSPSYLRDATSGYKQPIHSYMRFISACASTIYSSVRPHFQQNHPLFAPPSIATRCGQQLMRYSRSWDALHFIHHCSSYCTVDNEE